MFSCCYVVFNDFVVVTAPDLKVHCFVGGRFTPVANAARRIGHNLPLFYLSVFGDHVVFLISVCHDSRASSVFIRGVCFTEALQPSFLML